LVSCSPSGSCEESDQSVETYNGITYIVSECLELSEDSTPTGA